MDLKSNILCIVTSIMLTCTGCVNISANGGIADGSVSNQSENRSSTLTDSYSITQSKDSTLESVEVPPTQSSITTMELSEGSSIRYQQLNSTQKAVYDEVYNGIKEYQDTINISETINESDLSVIYDALINTAYFELVQPTRKYDFKYDSITGNIYKICPSYIVAQSVRDDMMNATNSVANYILSQVATMNDFEKIRYFHDYIVTHCSYDDSGQNFSNAYGALVEEKAVCEGYSRAFKYLCDMANIPCELVIGETDIDHMWNLVQVDGDWYHIDVTWDDPKNKDGDYISYTYFNLTDEEIFRDHTILDTAKFPEANSTRMNYYTYNGLVGSSTEEVYNILCDQVYKACMDGSRYVYVKASNKSVYKEALETLSNDSWYAMFNIIKNASNSAGIEIKNQNIVCGYDDVMYTITVTLY